jgi:hypothetical protein
MDGGEAVFLHHPLGNQDRILEVVAVPGHEGDQQILAQRQFAHVGGRPVGQHVTARHLSPTCDQGALVDAGILIGTGVLGQVIDVYARLAGFGFGIVDPHHNAASIHRIHQATALAITQTPESRATIRSIPVPTSGFSARRVGTA